MTAKFSIACELLKFVWLERKWWIAPIIVALLGIAFSGLVVKGSAASRFIYTLF